MKRYVRRVRLLLVTAPLAVAIPVPPDSSYVQFSGAAGAGNYLQVLEDCSGENIATTGVGKYRDAGAGLEFRDHSGTLVGVRGGVFENEGGSYEWGGPSGIAEDERGWWVTPYLGGDRQRVGFRAGLTHAEGRIDPNSGDDGPGNAPSIFLRLGDVRELYWTAAVGESFPIYSGGGYGFYSGFGGRPLRRLGVWLGAGTGLPYDGDTLGLALQTETQLFPRWYLDVTGRIDTREGTDQGGLSVGLTWRCFR